MTNQNGSSFQRLFTIKGGIIILMVLVLVFLALLLANRFWLGSPGIRDFDYIGRNFVVYSFEEIRSNQDMKLEDNNIRLTFTGSWMSSGIYGRIETSFTKDQYNRFMANFERFKTGLIQVTEPAMKYPRREPISDGKVHPLRAGLINLKVKERGVEEKQSKEVHAKREEPEKKQVVGLFIEAHPDFIRPVLLKKTDVKGRSFVKDVIDLNKK